MDLRMIAHDMRTPLSALTLSLELIRLNRGSPEDLREAVRLAERNARALSEIVESLVAASGNADGRGILERRECLPLDLVTAAVDQAAPMAAHKNQVLETGKLVALPAISVDGTRIVRALANLLSNAVKFTPPGGRIEVDAKQRINDGHATIVFRVADTGPGIEPDQIDRIFLEGVSVAKGGKYSSGLGLAVCKEIVEAHGGRIWVETGRKQGAAFAFSIPSEERCEPDKSA
jgi:signal transduction histidine kinase